MKRFSKFFVNFYRFAVSSLFLLFTVVLLILSILCFVYHEPTEMQFLCKDATLQQLAFIFALCFFIFLLARLESVKTAFLWLDKEENYRKCRNILLWIGFGLAAFWFLSTRIPPLADQRRTWWVAQALFHHDNSYFEPGSYPSIYPNVLGLACLEYFLMFPFGDNIIPVIQAMNAVAYVLILFETSVLSQRMGMRRGYSLLAMVLCIVYLPLLFYTSYVYGNLLGLCASMLAIHAAFAFLDKPNFFTAAASCLAVFFSILVKSNYLIFTVGIILYLLVHFIRTLKPRGLLLIFLLSISLVLALKLPVAFAEKKTSQNLSNGTISSSWAVMGLQEGSMGPGWFNQYNVSSYREAGYDTSVQKQIVRADFLARIQEFIQDPDVALDFFTRKTESQWCDPALEGIHILQKTDRPENPPEWLTRLLTPGQEIGVIHFLNIIHIWILFGAVLFAFSFFSSDFQIESTLPMMIFVGGFLFHLVWEAKSQYTFPYFMLLVPLAVQGYQRLVPLSQSLSRNTWKQPRVWLFFAIPVVILLLTAVYSHFAPLYTLESGRHHFYLFLETYPST